MNDQRPTPIYKTVVVTPELAAEWLKRNTHNRKLMPERVTLLADAMKRGEWQENGDAIRFDVNDVLLDGQHRLAAIAEARIPITMLVVQNLQPEAQMTVDVGKPRSFAQLLTLHGISDANQISALTRRIYLWEHGDRARRKSAMGTNTQLLFLVENNLDLIREAVSMASKVYKTVPASKATLGLAYWLFVHIDRDDAEFFFNRLGDGVGLEGDDPILVLRNALLTVARALDRPNQVVILAWIIKAWNSYRDGEQVNNVYFRAGGASPEKYPEPK